MRIRKNAKISTLLYPHTNLSTPSDECLLQNNLCQLNQSPWDIITFPSSDSSSSLHLLQSDDNEVYYNVNLAGICSSFDSIEAFESVAPMKISEGESYDLDDLKNDYREVLGFQGETVLCGKNDEKRCHCGKLVKNGKTVCDHHAVELQNDAVWTTKKKSRPIHGPKVGTKVRQAKKWASTNPYEFYYYSGFGPSWGKKRGKANATSNVYNEATKVTEIGSEDNDMNIGKDEKRFEPEVSTMHVKMDLAKSMDDDDDNDNDNKKGKMGIIGKKRGRKPIKARSLKSLM